MMIVAGVGARGAQREGLPDHKCFTRMFHPQEGTAALYTEAECWEDFMLGCVLWNFAQTRVNLNELPGASRLGHGTGARSQR